MTASLPTDLPVFDRTSMTISLTVDLDQEYELYNRWLLYEPESLPFMDEVHQRAVQLLTCVVEAGALDLGGWEVSVRSGTVSVNTNKTQTSDQDKEPF
jgi:hypothetical protein